MFETNPARRRPREIQTRLLLELSQLETETLEPGFDRLKLGSYCERLTSGQKADEIPRLTFDMTVSSAPSVWHECQ